MRKRNPIQDQGRPPLPKGEALTVQVGIRMTEEEKQLLEQAASKDGRTLSNFIRWAALGVARGEF